MVKWQCLGCGKVTEADKEPVKCSKCGDTEADNGGTPVFKK